MISENGREDSGVSDVETNDNRVFDLALLPNGSILEYENRSGVFQLVISGTTKKGSVRCFRKKLNQKDEESPEGDWIFIKKGKTELKAGKTFSYEINDDDDSGLNINEVPVIKKIRRLEI